MGIDTATKALLDRVLTWCGACEIGETPSSACEALAASEFLDMVHSWATDSGLGFVVRESADLDVGTEFVDIDPAGGAGFWKTTPPVKVLALRLEVGTAFYPLHVASEAEYNALGDKSVPGIPTMAWYCKETDDDGAVLYFDCPLEEDATLHMTSLKQMITSEPSATVDTNLPLHYWDAFNLALRLRVDGYFEGKVTEKDLILAENAKQAIRRLNAGPAPAPQPNTPVL